MPLGGIFFCPLVILQDNDVDGQVILCFPCVQLLVISMIYVRIVSDGEDKSGIPVPIGYRSSVVNQVE